MLTIIGIVAVINVINLIDGVDGLAAGVCVISAATMAVIALSLDRPGAGVLAALTAGGALGFLRHGFPPASSFMGDTGSNLLGYLLGAIAVQGALKTNAVVALFFPLVVLAVPILDTGFVIAKRIKYRQPIYRADRWHFHHRMANIGFSQRRTLAYLYGWALVMAGLALALRFVPYSDDHGHFNPWWTAVIGVCLVAALAASFYLVITLEILKLRTARFRELFGSRGAAPARRRGRRGRRPRARDRELPGRRPGHGRARTARSASVATPYPLLQACYKRRPPSALFSSILGGAAESWRSSGTGGCHVPGIRFWPALPGRFFNSPDDPYPSDGGRRHAARPAAGRGQLRRAGSCGARQSAAG